MKSITALLLTLLLAAWSHRSSADEFSDRCADRTAIERVYHAHRIGTTQTFEQAMPGELIERLVRDDLKKETVLRKVYGVVITPAIIAAEVERINTTTRAPEVLAEIKIALGSDAARFASAMARPILVERELRARFETDEKLHAAQRREAEQARESLLAGKPVANMHEVTWQLSARPADQNSEIRGQGSKSAAPTTPTQASAKSKSYTNEATAQLSQTINPPDNSAAGREKLYFEDLDPELQQVLRVQLQKPGDVSAVIEMPGGFLVFLTREKSAECLTVTSLSIPRRSYEAWLAQQP
jgi:hypothetical protein